MSADAFHSSPEQYGVYAERSIEIALSDGRVTQEDVSYVGDFLEEVDAANDLSPQRKFKLTCNLMNVMQYLPPSREITLGSVYKAVNSIKTAKKENGEEYSDNTKADLIRITKRYVTWLSENEHVTIDLAKLKKTVKVPTYSSKAKNEDSILTENEVKRLIETPRSLRYRAMLGVLYEGGFRIKEVATMRWSDVIFSEWGCRIRADGKTEKERNVPIIMYRELLAQWRTEHPDPSPDNFVFLNYHNKPLKYQSVAKTIQKFCTTAGIEKHLTTHIFRHSRITHVLRLGMHETLAKKTFWGNVNSDMLKVYAHLTDDDARDEFARLAGIEIPKEDKESELRPIQCSQCHRVMPPGSRFCARCGLTLTAEAAESVKTVVEAAEAVIANPNDPEALTILLEARAKMAKGE